MISLSQFSAKTVTAAIAGGAAVEGGDTGAANGDFAAFLNAIGTAPSPKAGVLPALPDAAPAGTAINITGANVTAISGTALPGGNEGGKILPVTLPVAAPLAGLEVSAVTAATAEVPVPSTLVLPIEAKQTPTADLASDVQKLFPPTILTASEEAAKEEASGTTIVGDDSTLVIDATAPVLAETIITLPVIPALPPFAGSQGTGTTAAGASASTPLPAAPQAPSHATQSAEPASPAVTVSVAAPQTAAPATMATSTALPIAAARIANAEKGSSESTLPVEDRGVADRSAATVTKAAEMAPTRLAGERMTSDRAPSSAATVYATEGATMPTSASAQAPAMTAASGSAMTAPATPITSPTTPAAVQDLAQIIDRLTAAREASVPAAAVVALNHADFGDLSLRFNQGREGGLSVQIAAADPDAHQAITAAVAQQQQQGTATPGDQRSAQDNAQPQQHARSRDAGAGTGSGTNERGSEASQNGSNRQPQSGQHNNGGRHAATTTTANPRQGGIFA